MTTQQNPIRWAFGLLAAACTALALVAPGMPVAHADPQGDAAVAIDQAWTAAGGDTSPLGPKAGDIYPSGAGFGQNFANGAVFFSPATGARSMFGAILDKYRAAGGPEGDLGFPNMDEGPGRISPESRNVTFNIPEGGVIFWTPQSGAWVVKGLLNSAWDKLGGSAGPLGVPVEDETYSGESISQRFTGGQLTYDAGARVFTTTPPELAGQLADLPLPDGATSEIDLAWRVAGGPAGQLGAKEGDPYPVGDGTGQNFVGGKIFYSPQSGAHVVSGMVLEKYEAAGGPTGELGFPTANEVDGDVPGSRVATFGAPDAPAIVWTAEHGAVIVRGAMKAAWDELGGSGGDLGVPISDQTGEGTVTQNFSGGQVTYNSSTNTFSTQPPELADRLDGVEVPEQNTAPSPAAPPAAQAQDGGTVDSGSSGWKSWYLWVIIPLAVLALGSLVAFLVMRQRRGGSREGGADFGDDFGDRDYRGPELPADAREDSDAREDFDETPNDERDDRDSWTSAGSGQSSGPTRFGDANFDDTDYLATQPPWAKRENGPKPWSDPVVPTGGLEASATGPGLFTHYGAQDDEKSPSDVDFDFGGDLGEINDVDDVADADVVEPLDPDDVDTAPTRIVTDVGEPSGRHAAITPDEESRPPWLADDEGYQPPGPNSLFAPVYGAVPPPAAAPSGYGIPREEVDESDSPSRFDQSVSEESAEPEDRTAERWGAEHRAAQIWGQDRDDEDRAPQDQVHEYRTPGDERAASESEPSESETVPPPAIHLPLDDPDEAPEGYPIKGSMRTGTYHSPGSASFDVTVAEIWFASEELAESNGFTRAE
ncbi:MAG: hypothetical protein WBB07_27290 [Mycobacterium sp.]